MARKGEELLAGKGVTGPGMEDLHGILQRLSVSRDEPIELHGGDTEPLDLGRRAPLAPLVHSEVQEQPMDDDRQISAEATPAFVAAEHRVVVLNQLEQRVGGEVLSILLPEAVPVTDVTTQIVD